MQTKIKSLFFSFPGLPVVVLFGLFCFFVPDVSRAQGTPQWQQMISGLTSGNRPYYDTALAYLDWMRTSSICAPDLKDQIDYQAALIHLGAIENGTTFLQREEHAKRCRELLEKFLKEHENSDQAFNAVTTLGRLSMEEGRMAIMRSEHEMTKDDEREPQRQKAREEFKKAIALYERSDKLATERARSLREKQKENASSIRESDLTTAYGDIIQGKIYTNMAKADLARSFPKDSKEYKDGLKSIAETFEKLSSRYNGYSASFTAKLNAAEVYKDLGDFKKTRSLLGELNALQGSDYQDILARSLLLALDMNLAEKKPENFSDSIARIRAWNENTSTSGKRSQQGQQIFLQGAKNLLAYAETVKDKKSEHDRAMRDAAAFLKQVQPNFSSVRVMKEANDLLQKIGVVKVDRSAPSDFAQGKEFADEDWQDFVRAFSNFQSTQGKDKEEAKKQADKTAADCLTSFNRALGMRKDDTPISEINAIRQNLITVLWWQGKTLEAALLADYLAQRYSGSPGMEKTAIMAVRLYREVFVKDKRDGHDPAAVAKRLDDLCRFIMGRWDGQPEVTGEVQLLQIETAIDNGNIEEAKKLLAGTAEGTPQRVSAELKIGQSLWNRYSTLSKLPEDSEDRPERKELDKLLVDARQQMERGVNGKIQLIKDGKIKPELAAVQCALALGQVYLNEGKSDEAIKWLTDPTVGPITLAANPPSGLDPALLKNLQLPATMLVLRAYVATESLDKAEETMNKLEAMVKQQASEGDPGAEEQRLTQIYVVLGRQLEERLKELNEEGEAEQAEKVAKGFELFLTRIRNRGESNSFQTMYWVADTFFRLGSGMSSETNVPDQAKEYFQQAARAYVAILKRVEDEPDWAPARAEWTIKTRLAESLRSIGLYEAAMKYLETLLEDGADGRIDIQFEAARILEAWGKKEDPLKIKMAIAGGRPSRKIWGWKGIIKRTSVDIDRLGPFYYEAYLNQFRGFLELGRNEKNREEREKYFDTLERDYRALIVQRPQLGGPEWFAKFDQVFKAMERARGNARPIGLKAFIETISSTPEPDIAPVADKAAAFVEKDETEIAANEAAAAVAAKKTAKKVAEKKKNSDRTMWIGLGIAAMATPVVMFFALRKKKKRR